MNRALRIAAAATGIGLTAILGAAYIVPARMPAELKPVWTEVKWPFQVDQWGIGRAFVCAPAACGVEVSVYLRPKVGFCKCATGVDDDDELERVGDNGLIGGNAAPLGAGRPIEVAWMKGRSRSYHMATPAPVKGRILSIGFNDGCDAMVALATLGDGDQDAQESAVLAFLNSERVLRWIKWVLVV